MNAFWTSLIITLILSAVWCLRILSKEEPVFNHRNRIVGNFREGGWILVIALIVLNILGSYAIDSVVNWIVTGK